MFYEELWVWLVVEESIFISHDNYFNLFWRISRLIDIVWLLGKFYACMNKAKEWKLFDE